MGCHTSTYIPKIKGKENIIKYWKDNCEFYFWEEEHEFIDWGNLDDYLFCAYHAWNFLRQMPDSDWWLYEEIKCLVDEPRIGGYPLRIVSSYEDMLDFMKTGFDREYNGKMTHFDFHYDEKDYNRIMSNIKNFFEKYPEGIISFG